MKTNHKLSTLVIGLSFGLVSMGLFPNVGFAEDPVPPEDPSCDTVSYDSVSDYCDTFQPTETYANCESDIDDHYVAEGHSDPNISHTEEITDVASRTGFTVSETRDLVCHGTGAGGGTGN